MVLLVLIFMSLSYGFDLGCYAAPGRVTSSHLSAMSFLTDVTPLTPRANSTARFIASCDVTKPLN